MRQKVIWSVQLSLVGLYALGLKAFYSTATADDLLWILAPTTALVELLSGRRFEFESYAGYMSSDHSFVIAVPCAGVNFLITAFLMLALRRLWRERFHAISWSFLLMSVVLAYVATLLANTTRIWLALEMRAQSVWVEWLTNNQLHRLEGILVYFLFLILLFVVTERFETAKPANFARASLFPLLIYYATTLIIPLLNGSYQRGSAFWEHFAFVLVLPLLVMLPLFLQQIVTANLRTPASRSDESASLPAPSTPDSPPSRPLRSFEKLHRRCRELRPRFPTRSS